MQLHRLVTEFKNFLQVENSPISPQYPYALTKSLGEQIIFHFGKLYKKFQS